MDVPVDWLVCVEDVLLGDGKVDPGEVCIVVVVVVGILVEAVVVVIVVVVVIAGGTLTYSRETLPGPRTIYAL